MVMVCNINIKYTNFQMIQTEYKSVTSNYASLTLGLCHYSGMKYVRSMTLLIRI